MDDRRGGYERLSASFFLPRSFVIERSDDHDLLVAAGELACFQGVDSDQHRAGSLEAPSMMGPVKAPDRSVSASGLSTRAMISADGQEGRLDTGRKQISGPRRGKREPLSSGLGSVVPPTSRLIASVLPGSRCSPNPAAPIGAPGVLGQTLSSCRPGSGRVMPDRPPPQLTKYAIGSNARAHADGTRRVETPSCVEARLPPVMACEVADSLTSRSSLRSLSSAAGTALTTPSSPSINRASDRGGEPPGRSSSLVAGPPPSRSGLR
jgi:hypothetical protein